MEIEDDDFNWSDFFKAQWADAVTVEKLNDFRITYKHSEEERKDLLTAYDYTKGDLDKLFARVMLSNPLDDEDRFRAIINAAISTGEVESYKAFTHEGEKKRKSRQRKACGEGREAEEHAKNLGIWDDLFGNVKNKTKTTTEDPDAALRELIQKRKRGDATQFLDNLEAKYGGGQRKSKKQKFEEPPEELFQNNRQKTRKKTKDEAEVEVEDNEEEVDLEGESADSEDHEDKEEEEEGSKRAKPKSRGTKSGGKSTKRTTRKGTKFESEVGDDREDLTPVKSKSNGPRGGAVRSPRKAKKASYKEFESSESEFDEDEEEQEFKPIQSKSKGSAKAKRTNGQPMAVRKKR